MTSNEYQLVSSDIISQTKVRNMKSLKQIQINQESDIEKYIGEKSL